jgi:hypothetical protein
MNVTHPVCRVLPVFLGLLCSAAAGQPVTSHRDSLQWMIARAEAIVRGNVDGVVALNPGDGFARFHQVTVTTRQGLAGEAGGRLCFVTADDGPYVELKEAGREALFFLVPSPRDFDRRTHERYYSRCPWRCENMIDLDAESVSVTSFDREGLSRIEGSRAILAKVEHYVRTRQRDGRARVYELREPNKWAYTRYDHFVRVPVGQDLYAVARRWSARGGLRGRIGREIDGLFTEPIGLEAAKAKYAAEDQVPTDRRHARTPSIDSLEWMAADSDVIVRGTIEDLVLVQLGDPDDIEDYDRTLDRHVVKLRVSERIKGETGDTIGFVLDNGGELSRWKERKVPLLVFLEDRRVPVRNAAGRPVVAGTRVPLRYAGRGWGAQSVVVLDEGRAEAFSAKLAWTDDPEEMLAIVRGYLERAGRAEAPRPQDRHAVSFQPPETYLKGSAWEGDRHVRMQFPIDAYLEEQARRWITSDRKEDRRLGAYALVYFKSDENAAALKGLLDDPGKWPKPVVVSMYTHQKVAYLVRWEAWAVLHAWGYDVQHPPARREATSCWERSTRSTAATALSR